MPKRRLLDLEIVLSPVAVWSGLQVVLALVAVAHCPTFGAHTVLALVAACLHRAQYTNPHRVVPSEYF
jgi:hypothetical protein